MGRAYRNQIHVGQRRQKQKNGDVYILERRTKYDPATKKTVTVGQKLLGKIVAGTTEMVPTRAKRPARAAPVSATRKHTGLTDILEHVGGESGIDGDVRRAFPEGGVAEKILSLARFWVATGGQTPPRMAAWQAMHPTPHPGTMSEDVIGDLFRQVGCDEEGIQRYFRLRAGRLGANPAVAYDSTTVSTYSERLHEARRGFNKDGDGLDTIKLLTLYSVKEREPIAFAKQPGNVPDVVSVGNALTQLECLGLTQALVVTDNGYYSQSNMAEFAVRGMKFLTLADPDVRWVRESIDALRDELEGGGCICPFDPDTCGATRFFPAQPLTRKKRGGGEETVSRRLWVHVFRSPDVRAKRECEFNRRLVEVRGLLERGEELSPSAQRWADRYLVVSRGGRKVACNDEAIREARKSFGFFALVTNQRMDTFEALRNYRLREKIEELYGMGKRYFDGRRPRLWNADALRGRQFVQFVGLGYLSRFRKKVGEMENALGREREGITQDRLKLEKNLKEWLKARSTLDIFDWFDCIETTQVATEAARFRWSTESVRRDDLFLSLLGLPSNQ